MRNPAYHNVCDIFSLTNIRNVGLFTSFAQTTTYGFPRCTSMGFRMGVRGWKNLIVLAKQQTTTRVLCVYRMRCGWTRVLDKYTKLRLLSNKSVSIQGDISLQLPSLEQNPRLNLYPFILHNKGASCRVDLMRRADRVFEFSEHWNLCCNLSRLNFADLNRFEAISFNLSCFHPPRRIFGCKPLMKGFRLILSIILTGFLLSNMSWPFG